jgi:hypothetical protein
MALKSIFCLVEIIFRKVWISGKYLLPLQIFSEVVEKIYKVGRSLLSDTLRVPCRHIDNSKIRIIF